MCKDSPNPELVQSFYYRGLKTQVLRIAIRLNIFSPLIDGPSDAQTISHSCQCDTNSIRLLLESLCSFGLLIKEDDRYLLTSTAKTFLVPSVKSYAGDWILAQTDPLIFEQVLQSVRSGKPFNYPMPWEQLAWLESYNTDRLREGIEMWTAAGLLSKPSKEIKVLDLACGSSIMSFALTRKYTEVEITCIDSPKVLEVAKDLSIRFGINSKTKFISGDLRNLELQENYYNVVLLGNATNFFTKPENLDLFHRVYRSLKKGGSFLINVTMDTGEMDAHIRLYSFVLWTLSGTLFYNFHDYRGWLIDSGFEEITQLSKLWLCSKKGWN